ncbi:MAG: thioredoxin family protein [Kiritimatiellae bacterium]|nr:thioredoxin family protein [Kiritimatiellia bacterium]
MKRFLYLCAVTVMAATTVSAAKGGWLDNFEQAKKDAAADGKPIFALFTGSDWCTWCVKLNDEILKTSDFKKFAQKNLVLFIADFPSQKKLKKAVERQNKELASKYHVKGYPTVLLLKADGTVIGKTGYQKGGGKEYVKMLKEKLGDALEEVVKPTAPKSLREKFGAPATPAGTAAPGRTPRPAGPVGK